MSVRKSPPGQTGGSIDSSEERPPEWFWETDRNGSFVFCSPSCEDLLGYSPAELLGNSALKKFAAAGDGLFRATAGANHAPLPLTSRLLTKSGTAVMVETFREVLRNHRAKIVGLRGRSRPVSEMVTPNGALKNAEIRRLESALKQRAQEVSEVNKALEALLEQSTRAIVDLETRIYDNLQELVFPYLDKLARKLEAREEILHVNVIRANLEKISSSFTLTVSSRLGGLTPRELQVAQLIKQGKTTKDISLLLHISPRTVEFYRDKLRKKFSLKGKRINLRAHLSTLS